MILKKIFELPSEPFGMDDSERCIEIPWAISCYNGEKRVLDIGYANAEDRYLERLLSLNIKELHGIDIIEKNIEGIIPHKSDIRNTNFPDDFFDLIYCISAIEHIGRNNSIYDKSFFEDSNDGDFEALSEIYRITKDGGKIVLTVPFGKYHNYGWFIQYDEKRWSKLIKSVNCNTIKEDFYKYNNGWHSCDRQELKEILYKDNNAPAAAGLVCILLEKVANSNLEINIKESAKNVERIDMNTIEIKDEEIKVEEIMAKIRENIRKRKEAGIYPKEDLSEISIEMDNIQDNLQYLKNNADIGNNNYFISSHRPFTGKFLVKGRSLINGEVRRYIDPVIWKQTEFNNELVKILSDAGTRIDLVYEYLDDIEHINDICERLSSTDNSIDTINERLDTTKTAFNDINTRISRLESDDKNISGLVKEEVAKQVDEILLSMDSEIKNREWLAHLLEKRIESGSDIKSVSSSASFEAPDLNYFIFEEKFRGSRKDIKERQNAFLQYFESCKNVLDIGCGRGEFLELMREQGIGARGVDLDETMVGFCHSKDLEVVLDDALSYLETLDDSSLDGIFIDQVVEHLEPVDLVHLLELCYKKLKLGYYIIAETVNPLSFFSFANFYIDLTHVRPVHPETLKYLFDVTGFREIEAQFSAPVSDENRLQYLPSLKIDEDNEENKKHFIESYNNNISMLNGILYGAQDYAVLGKK